MAAEEIVRDARTRLIGRQVELAELGRWLHEDGGGTLVLSGVAGVGKTALLDFVALDSAGNGFRCLATSGLQYETGISFAAVDRLVLGGLRPELPLLPAVIRLPLTVALGFEQGIAPTVLAVSAAFAALVRQAARSERLVVLVDDAQWLDQASAAALGHLARRAADCGVKLLLTLRPGVDPDGGWTDGTLPVLDVPPLGRESAEILVRQRYPEISDRALAWVLAEAGGLPLALIELPERMRPALDGRAAAPRLMGFLGERLTGLFGDLVRALPPLTRKALLLAALHAGADLSVLQSASGPDDVLSLLAPAERSRLVSVHDDNGRVDFQHPLARSTVVELATPLERRRAHRALAEALRDQPIQRAVHLAEATDEPDESVAHELEQAAEISLRRGDAAGAVTALATGAELSPDAASRRRRLVHAAAIEAEVAGDLDSARILLLLAGGSSDPVASLDAALAASAVLLNAEADVATAHWLLRHAIRRHPDPTDAADPVLVDALHTLVILSWFGSRPELWPGLVTTVAGLRPGPPSLLDVCARTFGDPVRLAAPVLNEVDRLVDSLITTDDPVEITRVAIGCVYIDRVEDCREPLARVIRAGRAGGAVGLAINAMVSTCVADWGSGQWDQALELAEEGRQLASRHGYRRYSAILGWYLRSLVLAARGEKAQALAAAKEMEAWGKPRGVGMADQFGSHIRVLVALADSRWQDALTAATSISPAGDLRPWQPHALWVALDLVEAAVRAGRSDLATAHAVAMTQAGVPALSSRLQLVTAGATAMASPDGDAADLFELALAAPEARRWPFEHARIQLHYGERLRRLRRPARAREVFREALDTFDRLGAMPWAARTAAGLRASGQASPVNPDPDVSGLTPRDWQIARLAASGMTNKQIGERLYLSPRTVGATLYRLFPVFGVTNRAALGAALSALRNPKQ